MDKTIKTIEKRNRPLVRMIIPVYPEVNIFTRQTEIITALGAIMVATAANKLWEWRVEVIDENNYRGPRNKQGLPDHLILQKENPAQAVGFYCGLTSTIERVWQLAEFYHQKGTLNLAGGWHAHYCPEETLEHNIDIVVHGDGEIAIQQILNALKKKEPFRGIPGISFLEGGRTKTNTPEMLEIPNLNNLPYPDFGLLRYANIKIYPIGRIRGCSMNCEFCSVKGKPRWSTAEYFFNLVKWLVETRKARHFFIVDDRLEENLEGTIDFFRKIYNRYGNRLVFTVQMRLGAARNTELLDIMKKAGVRVVAVGYESPIEEDLEVMNKGYSSSQMLKWTKILRRYFRIHGMFMAGYPLKEKKSSFSAEEIARRFKKFIRKASLDTVQVLHPVPIVGTALRQRLEKEGRIFPLELVPWSKYDGSYICFRPDNITIREFQEMPWKLMSKFYNPLSFIRILLRIIAFPIDYLVRGWRNWYRDWYKDVVKYGGYLLLQRWQKRQKGDFIKRLEKYNQKTE